MAGRHASSAPLLLTRGVVTVAVAAVLLAVGVLALTLLVSGGPPRAMSDRAASTPGVGPGDDPAPTGTATSRWLPTTTGGVPGEGAGVGAGGDGVGGDGAVTARPLLGMSGPQGGGPLVAPVRGVSPTLPGATTISPNPGIDQGVGWWLRSDAGRVHGRALGLLTRPGHGCQREVPGRGRAAHARPSGCP